MKMKFLALVAALVLANASHARADIIYTVHDVYHPINISPEAVDGKITTDGSFGVLTAANIVAWDLTISFLQQPLITLTNANGTVSTSGSALTATPVALLFNYGPPNFPATFLRFTAGTSLEPNAPFSIKAAVFMWDFATGLPNAKSSTRPSLRDWDCSRRHTASRRTPAFHHRPWRVGSPRLEEEAEASRLFNLVCGRKAPGRNAETPGGFLSARPFE